MTAHVLWWNSDRGDGFVRTTRGEDVYLHHTALINHAHAGHHWRDEANLTPGQIIDFDPIAGTVGTVAANASVVEG